MCIWLKTVFLDNIKIQPMKSIKLLCTFTMLCALLSCSKDDDRTRNVAGTYNLTAVNAPRPVDFNKDGTASINLMQESGCYANSFIELRPDGTFTYKYNYVFFLSTTGCYTEETTGIWQYKGNTITLTNPTAENEAMGSMQYTLQGNTLSITQDSSYPGYDSDGEPIFIEGRVETVYEKFMEE